MAQDAPAVREALESAVDNDEHKTLKQLMWGMRRNPDKLERQANRRNALVAALHAQERAGVAVEDGVARGVCEGQGAQQRTAGECRTAGLVE
uniref:hypothetical protein n=1 Tax=Verminephrobacter aporrectodeae TaxID=1110389 RepID=UPI0039088F1F